MRKHRMEKSQPLLVVHSLALKTGNYLLLAICVGIVLVPLFIVLLLSFKTKDEYMYTTIFELPRSFFNLENYQTFIQRAKLGIAIRNTLVLILTATPLSLLMGAMVSYVLERFRFPLHRLISALFALAVIIPSTTTHIATFTLIKAMGLYNTIFAGIVLFAGTGIVQIYIFQQFVHTIPHDLDESAMIDGARLPTVFWRIIFPQLKPAFATTAILKMIAIYNDMFIPYLYMPKNSLRVVTQAIRLFVTDTGGQWNVISAGVFIVLLPTLLIYLFAQRYIIAGVTAGAVKG